MNQNTYSDRIAPMVYALAGKRVWVAGHRGMVGSAIVRRLASVDCQVLTIDHQDLDLRRQRAVEDWMAAKKPQAVFVAAATVGGIHANNAYPADFIYDNLSIGSNIIHGAFQTGVEKLQFLGASCLYPRLAPQPMVEECLLTGLVEPTNEWYAMAKIAGIKLCQAYRRQHGCDFISVIPTNLYGPGDNFNLETGHVVAAMIAKAHEAKERGDDNIVVWGSGRPMREFMYVDDLADALLFLMERWSGEIQINCGSGQESSIGQLAETVCLAVGFKGTVDFDTSRPDGSPRKLIDSTRLHALGWRATTSLHSGLARTYAWYLENRPTLSFHRGGEVEP